MKRGYPEEEFYRFCRGLERKSEIRCCVGMLRGNLTRIERDSLSFRRGDNVSSAVFLDSLLGLSSILFRGFEFCAFRS